MDLNLQLAVLEKMRVDKYFTKSKDTLTLKYIHTHLRLTMLSDEKRKFCSVVAVLFI